MKKIELNITDDLYSALESLGPDIERVILGILKYQVVLCHRISATDQIEIYSILEKYEKQKNKN